MTSTDFLLRYASITTVLFDQIEDDLLALSCAFIDDDDAVPACWPEALPPAAPQPLDIPLA